jgi:hypothetical protein
MSMLAQEEADGWCFVLHESAVRKYKLLSTFAVSPVCLVPKAPSADGKPRWRRVINNSFAASAGGASLNSLTDFEGGPQCGFGSAFRGAMRRLYRLRLGDPDAPIYCGTNDVQAAFSQMKMAPHLAALFSYRLADLVVVPLRASFGHTLSPGYWDAFAQGIRRLVQQCTPASAVSPEAATLAKAHFTVVDRPT